MNSSLRVLEGGAGSLRWETREMKWNSHVLFISYLATCMQNYSVPRTTLFAVVVYSLNGVRLFVTPWTVACQAPLFMGFPRQEYWSGVPFPSPGDLPDPRMELVAPALQVDSLPSEPPGKPWTPPNRA